MSDAEEETVKGDGTGRLWLAVGVGCLICVGFLVYAVCAGKASLGGRGGVLALALTFYMLFLDRKTETRYLERDLPPKTDDAIGKLEAHHTQTRNALVAVIDWADKHKLPLAVLSIVGTIFAGFGDLAAEYLIAR